MKKPELRLEAQQQLTEKAQLIEEAKDFAARISKNPYELQMKLMKKNFPELSEQEIVDILAKP